MKFRPLHDGVVVKRIEVEEKCEVIAEVKVDGEELLIMKKSDIMASSVSRSLRRRAA